MYSALGVPINLYLASLSTHGECHERPEIYWPNSDLQYLQDWENDLFAHFVDQLYGSTVHAITIGQPVSVLGQMPPPAGGPKKFTPGQICPEHLLPDECPDILLLYFYTCLF